mmetsp:Transcript_5724/g.17756  ORF Transcript_5724/g.17756 Transcript_5724/m.17756 type:complete len:373 (-) Transcript_5724:60-1178(-)
MSDASDPDARRANRAEHLRAAEARLDLLAKPPGALGTLERWAATLCAAQRTLRPVVADPAALIFVGDHGAKLADASLSPYPAHVTASIFRALAAGTRWSCAAVFGQANDVRLVVVDVGIAADVSAVRAADAIVEVEHRKVALGTRDFRREAAMTAAQLDEALSRGSSVVARVAASGTNVVCVGEVGMGNTTSAAALLAALTSTDAAKCCGRGTGLDDAGLAHKIDTVRAACAAHAESIAGDPREALRRLGGLETAAMVGAFIEAEKLNVVAVVDGFISAVAALVAVRMLPACRSVMVFATALAEEPQASAGGAILAEALGDVHEALSMDLRLGECSAAILAVPLLRAAAALMGAATLEEALALGCDEGGATE